MDKVGANKILTDFSNEKVDTDLLEKLEDSSLINLHLAARLSNSLRRS